MIVGDDYKRAQALMNEAARELVDSVEVIPGKVYTYDDGTIKPAPDNVVEWMEARDSINESFVNLIAHAEAINAQVNVHRLMELNREMLDLIYQEYGVGD